MRNIGYFFNQFWINITRNILMSAAAISTSFFSQLILGGLILVVYNINHVSYQLWSEVEVWAYVDTHEHSDDDVGILFEKIKAHRFVESVSKVSPGDALDNLEKELEMGLWDRDEDNPLPWTFVIRVTDPDHIRPLVDYMVNDLKFKRQDLRYPEDVVRKLNTASMVIKVGGYILTVLMIGLTLFIISNTIRLTVIARRAEIRTMQLVGATGWFIRWPFMLEGIIIGLIGSFVSAIALGTAYYFVYDLFLKMLGFLPHPVPFLSMVKILFVILMLSGLVMGMAGSYISVTRFLDEEV